MITSKLHQAMNTVQIWAELGKGQEGHDWQSEMLIRQSDHDLAVELGIWWDAHPLNPNPLH